MNPAWKGSGVIDGSSVRAVVEAAGIRDILSKVLGTSNQASNVYATIEALKTLMPLEKKAVTVVSKQAAPSPRERETVNSKPKRASTTKVETPKASAKKVRGVKESKN